MPGPEKPLTRAERDMEILLMVKFLFEKIADPAEQRKRHQQCLKELKGEDRVSYIVAVNRKLKGMKAMADRADDKEIKTRILMLKTPNVPLDEPKGRKLK